MIWLKKNLLFTIAMVVLAGGLAVEIYMILGQHAAAREVEADFMAKVEEFQRLAGKDVLPHDRNVELTAAEIERQGEEMEMYQASMQGREGLSETFADYPTRRSDAFFEIAGFVDEYRSRAVDAGLAVGDVAASHFGFENYATVGPNEDQLAEVHKQQLVMAHILDRIFAARPESLIEVRRPGEAAGSNEGAQDDRGRNPAPAAGAGNFRLNSQLSAAIPDVAETSAYQIVFTGRASTLRSFLNELTSFDMPLIVRNVQVAPASEAPERREEQPRRRPSRRVERTPVPEGEATESEVAEVGEAPLGGERIPLVADNLSRFTVAMEFVEVKSAQASNQ